MPLPEWLQFHSLSRKREKKGHKGGSRVQSPKEETKGSSKQGQGRADLIDLAVVLTSRRRSLKASYELIHNSLALYNN